MTPFSPAPRAATTRNPWFPSTARSPTILLLLLLALFGPLPVGGDEAPVILCLGDSLTAGHQLGRQEGYPAQLQKRLQESGYPHRVINAGVSGDTTAGALRRLDWALRAKPALAIVELGANDGLRGLSLTQMERNLAKIIERLQEAGTVVLLTGMRIPPNYGRDYSEKFFAVYGRLAERFGLPLMPFFLDGVAGRPGLNLGDGIHPTAEGYAVVVENLWPHLEKLL